MLDEGPKDWELKEEEPPVTLQKKWEKEENEGPKRVVCPSCQKETPAENLNCVFCGTVLIPQVCPFTCFLKWIQRLWKKG